MKSVLFAASFLFLPAAAHAEDDYVKTIRKVLVAEENEDAAYDACSGGDAADESDLEGAARHDYAKARKAYRKAFGDGEPNLTTFKLESHTIYVIDASMEGNGCCRYYTKKGSHIDDMCGTESSSWGWSSQEKRSKREPRKKPR